MTHPSLSIVLCIHNEEKRLKECLKHLTFGNQLVIILDKCTDGSKKIAEEFGAKIIEGHYDLEGERRNLAINTASSDWVLEIDADEIVTQELADEILRTVKTSKADHHLLPFDNYIGDRLVRYGWGGSFGKSAAICLFRKGTKHWGPQRVHPKITFTGTRGTQLTTPVIHYVDENISDMIRRLDRYSTAQAIDLRSTQAFKDGTSPETLRKNIKRLFSRFFKCYVSRKGYKEGAMGFLVSLFGAIFPLLTYFKAKYEDDNGRMPAKLIQR